MLLADVPLLLDDVILKLFLAYAMMAGGAVAVVIGLIRLALTVGTRGEDDPPSSAQTAGQELQPPQP